MMTVRMLAVLMCAMLTLSACVIEPYGGERRDHYGGEHRNYGGDHHDYGRRVWHE
jgi:hypothetical protein